MRGKRESHDINYFFWLQHHTHTDRKCRANTENKMDKNSKFWNLSSKKGRLFTTAITWIEIYSFETDKKNDHISYLW